MAKGTTAFILLLLALCAVILLANGQAAPQALGAPAAAAAFGGRYPVRPPWKPGRRRCSPGETFKSCVSSSCGERKCWQVGRPRPVGCTLDCATGCFCKNHLYRNSKGHCVKARQCRRRQSVPYPGIRLSGGKPE
uniref:TIL domain-containing protein n=1 Tax=Amblyomma maculatum TaxID=34609 RepID=G3MLA6_AMBMU